MRLSTCRSLTLLPAFAFLLATGCASPWSIKIEGDVQGTDKDCPRDVHAGIHEGADHIRTTYQAAKGHLFMVPNAKVTVAYILGGGRKPTAEYEAACDSSTAKFHWAGSGDDGGPLTKVIIKVEAPGRKTEVQEFPCVAGTPFEAQLMAVLDEGDVSPGELHPGLPSGPATGGGTTGGGGGGMPGATGGH